MARNSSTMTALHLVLQNAARNRLTSSVPRGLRLLSAARPYSSSAPAATLAEEHGMSLQELQTGLGAEITTAPELTLVVPEVEAVEEPAFDNLGLDERLVKELRKRGMVKPTEVQAESIPLGVSGANVLCQAHTGTGKTLAFGLALLEQLSKTPQVKGGSFPAQPAGLVLVPTRELALQVERELAPYAAAIGRRMTVIYGGTPYRTQERALRQGVDLVIATPGRLLDHMEKNNLSMDSAGFLVLDEADQMLEIGFEKELNLIVGSMPDDTSRQTFLFSATMPKWVSQSSGRLFQTPPVRLNLVQKAAQTSANVHHLAVVCPSENYRNMALAPLIQTYGQGRGLIFTDTKADADGIGRSLGRTFPTAVLHGDVPQAAREKALNAFRKGEIDCLVATDVAARGIDVPLIPLVVQYRPPRSTETYIHRAGRTGRAGNTGVCALLYGTKDQEARVPAQLQGKAGFEFEFLGDLKKPLLGAATPEAVSMLLGDQLTKAKPADAVQKHFVPLITALCEQHNQTPTQVLAALVSRLGGFEKVQNLPSLLTRSESMSTFQINGEALKPGKRSNSQYSLVYKVLEQASLGTDSLGKMASQPDGTLFFDVHQDAVQAVLQVQGQFDNLILAVKPPMSGFGGGGKGRGAGKGGFGKGKGGGRKGGGSRFGGGGGSRKGGGKRY